MTLEQEVQIYRDLLMQLHLYRWTGNTVKFSRLMDKIAAYSYARTNSNFHETDEEVDEKLEKTLIGLSERE